VKQQISDYEIFGHRLSDLPNSRTKTPV
jgi:hypothetical protein